jgi:hypothetical protein
MNKEQKVNDKPKCTVGGSLRNGRAMCGYVIVGGVFCGADRGACNLQEGVEPGSANGVLVQADKPSN